jgi:hypothetical protein
MHGFSFRIRKASNFSFLAVVLVATVVLVPAVFGQAYFGTVSGELTDATGAVIAGAKAVLTDQQKGFTFEATSDTVGHYLFRSVPPGLYELAAESQGFSRTIQKSFKVDVNQNATVNLTMKVAGTELCQYL